MEKKYRKNPWRFLFLACAVYGALRLLGGVLMYALAVFAAGKTYSPALSLGIIGGADGPTAIFVTTPPWTSYVPAILLLVAGIYGLIRLRKRPKNAE